MHFKTKYHMNSALFLKTILGILELYKYLFCIVFFFLQSKYRCVKIIIVDCTQISHKVFFTTYYTLFVVYDLKT